MKTIKYFFKKIDEETDFPYKEKIKKLILSCIKRAFDEEIEILQPYLIPREIKRIRMAQDKFLKL